MKTFITTLVIVFFAIGCKKTTSCRDILIEKVHIDIEKYLDSIQSETDEEQSMTPEIINKVLKRYHPEMYWDSVAQMVMYPDTIDVCKI